MPVKARDDLSISYLRACFTYYPTTGKLIRKRRPLNHFKAKRDAIRWNARFAGVRIVRERCNVNGKPYLVSRISFALFHGRWPIGQVDHRRGRSNRIANLREATHGENQCNKRAMRNNALGVKNVYRRRGGGFTTGIQKDGIKYRERYKTLSAAKRDAERMQRRLHGTFARS